MPATAQQSRNVTLVALVSLVALSLALLKGGHLLGVPSLVGVIGAVLAIAVIAVGLVLVVLTFRLKEGRVQRTLFLLAGASPAAMLICALLHNLVYALFIVWFGEGFWERHGTDEPVFFILAVIVCPALFLVGTLGSIVLLIKARMAKQ